MIDLDALKFYATSPHPCSYLDDQEATSVFLDPNETVTKELYSDLINVGFRRSGSHVYRPHCEQCQACLSVRIVCKDFVPKRQQKRILLKNRDVLVEEVSCIDNDECYKLFEKYINTRHQDGDMHPTNRGDYQRFLCEGTASNTYFRFTLNNELIAVTAADKVNNGLSAIYSFFEPTHAKRSLGGYMVLWQIQECARQELPYLYLGYWIKNCQKMNYKSNYRPLEMYLNNRWQRLN